MEEIMLEALVREGKEGKGTSAARKIRSRGAIPVSLYGKGVENLLLEVDRMKLRRILQKEGENAIITLKLLNREDKEKRNVLIKDIQQDPVSGRFIHADFYQISLKEKITVDVPIKVVGTAQGVSDGGVLELRLREIHVRCLPMDIPDDIEIDVTRLGIGDSVRVQDLKVSEKLEVLSDLDADIASVVAPTKLEEKAPEAAAVSAAGEPEVIAKGKKEEEGAEVAGKTEEKKESTKPAKEEKK